MTPDRYEQLMHDDQLLMTAEEVHAGWRFCMCEWDGLLIKAGDPEAMCCSCYFDKLGNELMGPFQLEK